ncbi:preprotein translocase subunit SecG [Thalassotalea piscium]
MYQVLIVVYLIVAICLIGLVLIQQGKGADMGASFGAGSSATIFGSSGSGNFLTKTTTWLAVAFFIISLVLGNLTANRVKATDEWNDLANPVAEQNADDIPSVSAEPQVSENSDVPAASIKETTEQQKKDNDIPD